MTQPPAIAFFISNHGFGHACRAAAVMAAIERRAPQTRFELFTTCPKWLFEDTLANGFGYYEVQSDVGIVQRSALEEDWWATSRELSAWLPFHPDTIDRLAAHLQQTQCRLVVCDISAMGIAAAKAAGLPSVLIENFTWDYLYAPFFDQVPDLEIPTYCLKNIYSQVDLHIQTQPLCKHAADAIQVGPISRRPRTPATRIREQLNIPPEAKMVLVSMGGVPDRFDFLERLPAWIDAYLVIPGTQHISCDHEKVILLPAHSNYFHPDLIQAADLIVAKAGYSTIAEAYQAGLPFAYVARPQSPESPALEHFLDSRLASVRITPEQYNRGQWITMLPDLLKLSRNTSPAENGADKVARLLLELLMR